MYGLPVRPDAAPAERTNEVSLSYTLDLGERRWYDYRIKHQPCQKKIGMGSVGVITRYAGKLCRYDVFVNVQRDFSTSGVRHG